MFNYQLGAVWAGRRLFGEEFRYIDADGRERACLMQCRVNERDGQPDFSRVVLVLLDVTTAKRTSAAKMENQQLLREILARANILMWWAQVRREGGQLRWKLNVPSQSYDSQLYQLATAMDRGGLWDGARASAGPTGPTGWTGRARPSGSRGRETTTAPTAPAFTSTCAGAAPSARTPSSGEARSSRAKAGSSTGPLSCARIRAAASSVATVSSAGFRSNPRANRPKGGLDVSRRAAG